MPDAENPAPHSYNEYRKSTVGGAVASPLVTAVNNADGSTATLRDLSQAAELRAAGMFFGESPSPSSYADTLLQFGSINRPDAGTRGDTNNRTSWDLRFGFTESPDDWIAGKAPNIEAWDMWTADHGSDTVYMQVEIGATNDVSQSPIADDPNTPEVDEATNVFLGITRAVVGQSGNDTLLANEQGRNQWLGENSTSNLHLENTLAFNAPEVERISTGETLEITAAPSPELYDTGAGYDDLVGVQWRMELNDPENPNPDLARQVRFIFEAGDVRYSQVFDPGDAENPVEPNFTNDALNFFTDNFFDWENAYPVFFVGASGGSLLSTTGVIGFDQVGGGGGVEGDYNNNGTVEQADLDLVLLNWGQDGATPPASWTNDLPEGNIDQAELDGVLLNWGNTGGLASEGAAPEPASYVLLVLCSVFVLATRLRRCLCGCR
jgi:hypothetical protein